MFWGRNRCGKKSENFGSDEWVGTRFKRDWGIDRRERVRNNIKELVERGSICNSFVEGIEFSGLLIGGKRRRDRPGDVVRSVINSKGTCCNTIRGRGITEDEWSVWWRKRDRDIIESLCKGGKEICINEGESRSKWEGNFFGGMKEREVMKRVEERSSKWVVKRDPLKVFSHALNLFRL
jgi:hypothetical protein